MRSRRTGDGQGRPRILMGAMLLLALSGCGAPPSIGPLLDLSGAVLDREAGRLDADAEAAHDRLELQASMLASAFDRDLNERATLNADWVSEAVSAYVAAREALVRQAAEVESSYAARVDDLRAAREAQRRAVSLLERQQTILPWPASWRGWSLRDAVIGQADSLIPSGDKR